MKKWLLALALVLTVAVGAAVGLGLAYRLGVGRTELPGPTHALWEHLSAQGVDTEASVTRRGALAEVRQHVIFRVDDPEERVFFVMWCDSPEAAQRQRERLLRAPSPSLPEVNGDLVVYLTDWEADAPLTRRVLDAFRSFEAP